MARKNINLIKLFYLFLLCFFSIIGVSEAENKLLMITDKSCLYCIIWEKQIGKIYPKTDIAKNYSLYRIEIDDFKKNKNNSIKNIKVTPTFIFLQDEKEKGRITGYSNPEMFWWQVDEIINQ